MCVLPSSAQCRPPTAASLRLRLRLHSPRALRRAQTRMSAWLYSLRRHPHKMVPSQVPTIRSTWTTRTRSRLLRHRSLAGPVMPLAPPQAPALRRLKNRLGESGGSRQKKKWTSHRPRPPGGHSQCHPIPHLLRFLRGTARFRHELYDVILKFFSLLVFDLFVRGRQEPRRSARPVAPRMSH